MTDDPDDPSPDDLPVIPAVDPFQRILWFMEQCRKRGIRIGPRLKVGEIEMQVIDMRQMAMENRGDAGDERTIWEQAGLESGE